MKKVLLLTTIGVLVFTILKAQPNVFDPADPIVPYNSSSPPVTQWGNIQKWVVTNRNLGWNTSSFKSYHFNNISFRVKFPKTYAHNVADGKKYPVMLFWHGAGEKGTVYDNELQLLHGGQLFRNRVDNGQFDGFLVYPQNTSGFFGNSYYGPMIQVLDSLAKYCKLDIDRVLVNGLSAGGSATFEITAGYPTRITKAAPSAASAGALVNIVPQWVHIPVWFATGGQDTNPSPFMAQITHDSLKNRGADVRWTLYPSLGHFVWNNHWQEADFVPYMNDIHKANPLVFFQRNLFCPDSPTNARLGISPGFFEYEWQVNTGSGYTTIAGATSNEYTATSYGTYRVRFKRTSTSAFSEWSPKPVTVGPKTTTVTPDINVKGLRSKVLPAPDGSTTVPLRIAPGFVGYEFWHLPDSVLVSTDSIFEATPGQYRGRVKEVFGCNAFFSNVFTVVPANGVNKPDPAKNLTAFAASQSSIELNWSDNPNPAFNETGFEIYRRTTPDGAYTLIAITGPNVLNYIDQNLLANKTYYYIVRAINNTSAAPSNSNEANATTIADNTPPTAPGNLRFTLAGRFSVSLEWDASTDDAGVSKYDVYVNNVKLYTTDKTSFVVNELDSFQRYNFMVKAKDPTGNISPASNQISVVTKLQGLFYKHYHGSWGALPDFNNLGTPAKTGISTTSTDIAARTQNDNFSFIWRGYIKIPTNATYTFETCSDDGSKLYVNMEYDSAAAATVSNDFAHGPTCVTGTGIVLGAGQVVPITATFFEAGGGEQMQVWWRNNAGLARVQIPASQFFDTFTPTGAAPTAPSGLNATAVSFSRINLSWNDNSSNESGFEVVRSTSSGGVYVNIGTTGAGVNSFADTVGLNASTTYWYKVRSIGATGESAFTSAVSATTQALPPAPAAPTVLSAQVISSSQINLVWNDNSANETVFEIYRSTNNNANFRLITTVAGGAGAQKNYADQGLFANVTYFYKVRARGIGGPSAYTNEVNGKTLNTVPVVNDVLDFTIRHSVQFIMPLTATDDDGDALSFTSDNLPSFASIVPGTLGTAEVVFNPGFGDQGGYVINIYVNDGNGGKDTTYLNLLVNDNFPPTLDPVANATIDEGASMNLPLVANDNENPSFIGWTFTNLPSFASFNHNGTGGGTLQIAPGYAASGVYNVSVMVDDGFGAWTTRSFTITVNEKDPNERILVSIRTATDAPAPWNNMPSQSISNLKNTNDVTTTVGANVVNSWQFNLADQGAQTGNNSGIYPDAVMKDNIHWGYFLGSNAVDTSDLRITGLNPARKYTLIFFGSSIYNLYPDNGTTTYKVGAASASIGVQGNTTNRAVLNDISPDASGVITVKMIGDPHPDLGGWLNAFEIINQYDDGTIPVKATDLAGEFVEHTGTLLTWTDVAYNEHRYKIYRATNINGPYTLLNPGSNNANTTTYTDATAVPVTQYYYYVVASNTLGDSEPSDTISVLTGNNSPLINNLDNMFVKTESSLNEPFTVTDNAGDIVTVTAPVLPPFVTLQSLGGNNYQLVANPGKEYLGMHNITIQAADNKGGINTKSITILVADKRTRSFFVNFGPDGNDSPAPWNDFLGFAYAGKQLLNLKDEAGVTTGVSIRIDSSFTNVYGLGYITGNNSGVYPDSVLSGGISSNYTTARRITFLGLDPTKRYNVALIGSSNEGVNASGDYSATGALNTSQNARYNTHRVSYLNSITPTASNTLQISVTKQASSGFTYLSGLVLEEYTDTVLLMNPIHLYAEPLSKTSVLLTWADRTDVETGYEVYRATNAAGPWTLVNTTAANATTFTNTGLTANTKYWYRVRARRNTGPAFSEYSNTEVTITPKSIVLVNLTFTEPAASPWNNTNFNPDEGRVLENLKNDVNQPTGIDLTVTKALNGQNDMGMTTGGVVPAAVMGSCYWGDRLQQSQLKLTGLNHSKRYRIGFFGSIGPGWDGDFTGKYSIGNRSVYLNSYRNDSEIAYIGDVQPDANGEVLLDISTTPWAQYSFTSAIVIWAYDDATGGTVTNRMNDSEGPEATDVVRSAQAVQEPAVAEEVKKIRIQAYPNPFTDNIKIDFNNTSANNQVTVDIIDLTGRVVFKQDAGRVPAGMNTIRLNVPDGSFAPGIYIVRLNINGQTVNTAKLIKARK
ncbi:MAG TPA: PA14 domain-containing protein [Chitinophagaceae bacterium]|nr:PA14 domain-containing protein [Chitinophagaceae bacterium]